MVDGAVCSVGAGIGVLIKGLDRIGIKYAARIGFVTSNNVAEYEALILRLQIALEIGITDLKINSDSQLVVNQVSGTFQTNEDMAKYVSIIKQLMAEGEKRNDGQWRLSQIPRAENQGADGIAKMAVEGMAIPNVLTEEIKSPSITKTNVLPVEDNRG